MHAEYVPGITTDKHMPGWVAMIIINIASLALVAALVALSVGFDAFVFDLR